MTLHPNEARLDLAVVVDAIPDITLVIDREYRVVLANRAARTLGDATASPSEAPVHCYELSHRESRPCDSEAHPCPLREVVETKAPATVTHRHTGPGGEQVVVEIVALPVLGASGEVEHVVEVCRDVTPFERSREALAESEERYRTLFNAANDALFLAEVGDETGPGPLLEVNDVACQLLGYSPEEMVGRSPTAFLASDSERQNPHEAAAGYVFERVMLTRDGTRVPVEISARRLELGGREVILAVARDTTERRKLMRELLKAQKLESLATLAGGIAHDFNNILAAALVGVGLARRSAAPNTTVAEDLDDAVEALERAKALTRQLLTFAGRGAPAKSAQQLGAVVGDAATLAVSGTQAKLRTSFPHDLWSAEVDVELFRPVIQNLVRNAVQAMPQGGTVDISARNDSAPPPHLGLREGRHVRVTVRDSGEGIAPEDLDRIFDPFFTTRADASGLGLSAAHSIVTDHGGRITVESVVGEGSSFDIYLPAISHATGRATSLRPEPTRNADGRILVMDDDDLVRKSTVRVLQWFGYTTATARNGQEALAAYAAAREAGSPFDVVIMDLTIAGGSGGVATISELLELDPQAKAVVASGYSEDPVLTRFRVHGFAGAICKPYEPEELHGLLSQLIERVG